MARLDSRIPRLVFIFNRHIILHWTYKCSPMEPELLYWTSFLSNQPFLGNSPVFRYPNCIFY